MAGARGASYIAAMHRQSPLDWISRALMLVLSAMVTLSVVGVISAIPNGAMKDRIGIERPRQQQPVPEQPQADPAPPQQEVRQPQNGQPDQPQGTSGSGGSYGAPGLAAPVAEKPEVEQWLEAITYALMALVGLAALATLILWRSLKERRRIADALEALFQQRP